MAKLIMSMNQSLDGYVNHDKFMPGPGLFRHFTQPARARVSVSSISFKAHAASPSIILRMRPVTCLRSASISASERGGSNT